MKMGHGSTLFNTELIIKLEPNVDIDMTGQEDIAILVNQQMPGDYFTKGYEIIDLDTSFIARWSKANHIKFNGSF